MSKKAIDKVVILAGGAGTRLSEETYLKPKPMIEIGDKPILWHIMKHYTHYGVTNFIICLGYKGHLIKEYFANYFLYTSDMTFDLRKNTFEMHQSVTEPWIVTLVDTGTETSTGGRLKLIENYVKNETFCMTYGDGISDINISHLIDFHQRHDRYATVTAVRPPARFGATQIEQGQVIGFQEKPTGEGGYINGGFFILTPEVFQYIENRFMPWEKRPLEKLVEENQLSAYIHDGFWHSMDTLRDKNKLNNLWLSNEAPWKIWE